MGRISGMSGTAKYLVDIIPCVTIEDREMGMGTDLVI